MAACGRFSLHSRRSAVRHALPSLSFCNILRSYVRELLRLKGVYAPGRVHTVTTGKAGKSVIQASNASLLPCPAPKWSDFRCDTALTRFTFSFLRLRGTWQLTLDAGWRSMLPLTRTSSA